MKTIQLSVACALTAALVATASLAQPRFGDRARQGRGMGSQVLVLDLAGDGIGLEATVTTSLLGVVARPVRWTGPGTDDGFLVADADQLRAVGILGPPILGGDPPTGWLLVKSSPGEHRPARRRSAPLYGAAAKRAAGEAGSEEKAPLWTALAKLDSNADGVLDGRDEAWGGLRLLIDANGDGAIQDSELVTLEEAGVASLPLADGPFVRADGSEGTAEAVSLIVAQR